MFGLFKCTALKRRFSGQIAQVGVAGDGGQCAAGGVNDWSGVVASARCIAWRRRAGHDLGRLLTHSNYSSARRYINSIVSGF